MWTEELPTKDGWYWWRFGKDRLQIIRVYQGHTFKMGTSHFQTPEALRGEWRGPLELPPDDDEAGSTAGLTPPPSLDDMAAKLGTTRTGVLREALRLLEENLSQRRELEHGP